MISKTHQTCGTPGDIPYQEDPNYPHNMYHIFLLLLHALPIDQSQAHVCRAVGTGRLRLLGEFILEHLIGNLGTYLYLQRACTFVGATRRSVKNANNACVSR